VHLKSEDEGRHLFQVKLKIWEELYYKGVGEIFVEGGRDSDPRRSGSEAKGKVRGGKGKRPTFSGCGGVLLKKTSKNWSPP